jgi:hypothetical protein
MDQRSDDLYRVVSLDLREHANRERAEFTDQVAKDCR